MIYKCKICGGELEIIDDCNVCTCMYCGTKQTIPHNFDEKRQNLYNRANYLRMNGDFDKAEEIYEKIIEEDNTDSEAYWNLVLCKYGVEYVEEENTKKRVITCNRTQFHSVFTDVDFIAAMEYADSKQKFILDSEAKAIGDIQKGILTIVEKEEPFDIFLCYKETDAEGKRTPDSVLAQELYFELVNEGYRVFFSRITLEDKPGIVYEPYIFAALNSAKVMVVVSTKAEYMNSAWVKNEWKRYLALIKQGEKKVLIPAYKGMKISELPEELSYFQAQDMDKLGFLQDLIYGISKIIDVKPAVDYRKEQKPEKEQIQKNVDINALLERANMCLEEHNWNKADQYLENVLNLEAKNAKAYLGKLMIDLKISKVSDMAKGECPLEQSQYFEKVMRFADENTKSALSECNRIIKVRQEEKQKEQLYKKACEISTSVKITDIRTAIKQFQAMAEYKDSLEKVKECEKKIKDIENLEEKRDKKLKSIVVAVILSIVGILMICIFISSKYEKAEKEKIWQSLEDSIWFSKKGSESYIIHLKRYESQILVTNMDIENYYSYECDVNMDIDFNDNIYINIIGNVLGKDVNETYNVKFEDYSKTKLSELEVYSKKNETFWYLGRGQDMDMQNIGKILKARDYVCGEWTCTGMIKEGNEFSFSQMKEQLGTDALKHLIFEPDGSISFGFGGNTHWDTDGKQYYLFTKYGSKSILKNWEDKWIYSNDVSNVKWIFEKGDFSSSELREREDTQ